MVKMGGYRLELLDDRKMLGAYAFALAAGNAVFRLAEFLRKDLVICKIDRPALQCGSAPGGYDPAAARAGLPEAQACRADRIFSYSLKTPKLFACRSPRLPDTALRPWRCQISS